MVREMIAESWIQIQEFRPLVLCTEWLIGQSSTAGVRQYVSACKVRAAEVPRHDFARLLEDSPRRNKAIKVMVDYMDSTTRNL